MEQLDLFTWLEQCQEVLADANLTKEPWDEQEIEWLHSYLLDKSLEALKRSSTPPKKREEILDWLTCPIDENPAPFSFQACCFYEQVNAENMMELVLKEFGYGISTRLQ